MSEQAPTTRQCPFCKEEIKADALRCKHCLAAIPLREMPAHQGICPLCKEEIHPEAIRCKHCKADLVGGQERFFRERRTAGLPTPFQRTAPGRRIALRTARRPCGAENDPGIDPSGCLEVVHGGGSMYCLDYVYWEIDTNETMCFYTECVLT